MQNSRRLNSAQVVELDFNSHSPMTVASKKSEPELVTCKATNFMLDLSTRSVLLESIILAYVFNCVSRHIDFGTAPVFSEFIERILEEC